MLLFGDVFHMDIEPMNMAKHNILLTCQPHALQRLGSIGLHPAGTDLQRSYPLTTFGSQNEKNIEKKTWQRPNLKSKSIHLFLCHFCPTLDHFNVISHPPSATLLQKTHLPNLPKDLQNILRQPQGWASRSLKIDHDHSHWWYYHHKNSRLPAQCPSIRPH